MASKKGSDRQKNGQFAPGWRGGPGRPRKDSASESPASESPAPQPRADGFANAITGLGYAGRDKRLGARVCSTIVDDETAAELWETNPMAARMVETWPSEMLREGADVVIADERGKVSDTGREISEQVEARLEELGVFHELWMGLSYERAYGGGAILLGANDSQDLTRPLDVDRVRSLDWMTVFEPREITPSFWYTNPRAKHFGKPSHFRINASTPGTSETGESFSDFDVHESRLIIFPGIKVSRHRTRGLRSFWGGSILTRVYESIRDYDGSMSAAAVLLQDFSQAVYKIKGLADASVQDHDDEIKARLQAVDLARSIVRAVVIDSEEEFGRQQTTVNGMAELIDRLTTKLAAAADMPLTLLMGQSPGGMNATGESDIRFFYDRVKAAQSRILKPILEKIVALVFRDLDIEEPEKWSIQFRPLWQQSDKEKAEARNLQAETDKIYIENMVVSPEDVARSRFGGDGYSFETSIDFEERAKMEAEAKELERKMQEQSIESAKAAAGKPTESDDKPEDEDA